MALLGAYAWAVDQPVWVWFSLLLSGALLTPLMVWSTFSIARAYDQADLRRTIASDL